MKKLSKKELAKQVKATHVSETTEAKVTKLVVKMLTNKKGKPVTLDREVVATKAKLSVRTVDRVLSLMKLRGSLEKVNKNLFTLK